MSSKKRIEGVLKVRQIQEEIERAKLAAANQAVTVAVSDEASWRNDIDAWSHMEAPKEAPLWLSWQRQLSAAGDGLTRRQATVASRRVSAAAAHTVWAKSQQRVDGLERLVERLVERETHELLLAEQNFVDDTVSARYTAALNAGDSGELT